MLRNNLKRLIRMKTGLTQREFVELINNKYPHIKLSTQLLSNIINNGDKFRCHIELGLIIAKELDCKTEDIWWTE